MYGQMKINNVICCLFLSISQFDFPPFHVDYTIHILKQAFPSRWQRIVSNQIFKNHFSLTIPAKKSSFPKFQKNV